MRKLSALVAVLLLSFSAFAQEDPSKKKEFDVSRAGDHIMVQLGLNGLQGAPDSIKDHMKGLQRSANIYIMIDKKFKGNPRFSVAIGAGIGTNNYYFKNMIVDIGSTNPVLPFISTDSSQNFKKYKMSTTFLEVPLEFRFTAKPDMPNKSIKAAIGVKGGTMLSAKTKGKILRNVDGSVINNYTVKTISKSYFNTTRLAGTARVGYGMFSLFGVYSFSGLFKDGVAAEMNSIQVGLTISGL
jgi:hypothetical protein